MTACGAQDFSTSEKKEPAGSISDSDISTNGNSANSENAPDNSSSLPTGENPLGSSELTPESRFEGNVYEFPIAGLDPKQVYTSLPKPLPTAWLVGAIYTDKIDVAPRDFNQGFPNLPKPKQRDTLLEWFAIHYKGNLVVPTAGDYQFKITSDDGSLVLIESNIVVDNDGQHGFVSAQSENVPLEAKVYPIEILYYQGPKFSLGIQLFWKKPGDSDYSIIPATAFEKLQKSEK